MSEKKVFGGATGVPWQVKGTIGQHNLGATDLAQIKLCKIEENETKTIYQYFEITPELDAVHKIKIQFQT